MENEKDYWMVLRTSIFPGATDASIKLALAYCTARKLDPLKKFVHIVPMSTKDAKTGKYAYRDVIMPGIAEQRITAMRTGVYAGQDDVEFGKEITYKGLQCPSYAKATVYRLVGNKRCAFSHTEFFRECVNIDRYGKINHIWEKRPYGQNAKCAESGALRKAFPSEVGGSITAEEIGETSGGFEVYTSSAINIVDADEGEITIPSEITEYTEDSSALEVPEASEEKITSQQVKLLAAKLSEKDEGMFLEKFQILSLESLPKRKINEALGWGSDLVVDDGDFPF